MIGTSLGPYRILARLGEGGMGEVFEARDLRLDRSVAVKILRPEGFAGGSDGRARFEREARAVASLAHPNICTLYDVGRQDGVDYLVMELLRGETLAARLARGPLPIDDTIAIAIQVAGALDTAHRQGIVHRDLKPANVMLTPAGVKLLDFGLARLLQPDTPGADAATIAAAPLTAAGAIPGTVPYMAPEQLEGKPPDARSDLFALGAVVYEMATGRRPFEGESSAAVIAAILHATPPPLDELRPDAPRTLSRLVRTCLAKDPRERWSSAHDLVLVLEEVRAERTERTERGGSSGEAAGAAASSPGAPVAPAVQRRSHSVLALAAVGLAIAATVAAVYLFARKDGREAGAAGGVFSILPPDGTSLSVVENVEVSPDGNSFAFVATDAAGRTLLYVRRRDSLAARTLEGTDDATLPFWSPDGTRLGFFARGSLWTVAVAGGSPQALAPATVPRGGTWGRGDVIVYIAYPNDPPRQVPASGGDAKVVPLPEPFDERRWFPRFLPDGRRYLYLSVGLEKRVAERVAVASLDSSEVVELMPAGSPAVYTDPGYLLFRRDAALVAQRFDPATLKLSGPAEVVADRVGFNPIGYQGYFSASPAGVVAYREPEPGWNLAWFDRQGRALGRAGQPGQFLSLCLSHDGKRVVFDAADASGNVDVWSLDLASGVPTRLTFEEPPDFFPVCSPVDDGIFFSSLRSGTLTPYRQARPAPGSETPIRVSQLPAVVTDASRDGRRILYSESNPATSWDIWAAPLDGGKPVPISVTPAQERNGRFSPDGRWIAYTLQQGTATEVYVQPFPPTGAKWQVSSGGGRQPVWGPDGKRLFYLSSDHRLMEVEVSAGASGFSAGRARTVALTQVAGLERTTQGASFAVSPDGERLLVVSAGDRPTPFIVRLGWPRR